MIIDDIGLSGDAKPKVEAKDDEQAHPQETKDEGELSRQFIAFT